MAEKGQVRPETTSSSRGTVGAPAERRKRVALRRLIDEMLAEIRAAANEENWTAEARAQAESDLARIMDQVRQEAMRAEKPRAKREKPAR
jgi:hypothetical protein